MSGILGKRLGSALYRSRGLPNDLSVTILNAQNVASVNLCAIVREGAVGGEKVNVANLEGANGKRGASNILAVVLELEPTVTHLAPDAILSGPNDRLD